MSVQDSPRPFRSQTERIVYYRLHGSPRIYYSNDDDAYLDALAAKLLEHARSNVPVWCIFDNTAHDFATVNALDLMKRLSGSHSPS